MLRALAPAVLLLLTLIPTPANAIGEIGNGPVYVSGMGLTPDDHCAEATTATIALTTTLFIIDAGQHCGLLAPHVMTWRYDERFGYMLYGGTSVGRYWESQGTWNLYIDLGPCRAHTACPIPYGWTTIAGQFERGTILF